MDREASTSLRLPGKDGGTELREHHTGEHMQAGLRGSGKHRRDRQTAREMVSPYMVCKAGQQAHGL